MFVRKSCFQHLEIILCQFLYSEPCIYIRRKPLLKKIRKKKINANEIPRLSSHFVLWSVYSAILKS